MKITPQVSFGKWSQDNKTQETLKSIRKDVGDSGKSDFNKISAKIEKSDAVVSVKKFSEYRDCLIYKVMDKKMPNGGFTATHYTECLSPLQSLIQVHKRITQD